jgi:CRP/FNR family transcriptional regulator, anaerobic regulatory protein
MAPREIIPSAPRPAASSPRPGAQVACGACGMNPLCHPIATLPGPAVAVERRRRLASGDALFSAGAPRKAIYALRAGFLKVTVSDGADGQHIVRFLLPGDVAGLDSFATGVHLSNVVAVGDCEVCEIPAYRAELLSDSGSARGQHLRRLIAGDLACTQEHAAALARLTATQRVALLLCELSRRWTERGYSGTAFVLPMGRRDIGEHLGLAMETVSRILSVMHRNGWIRLSPGAVEILRPADIEGLRAAGATA